MGNKNGSKKFIVNGQDVIDYMLGDLGLGLSVDEIVETLEMKVDSDCFTYEEDRENLGKDWHIEVGGWSISIEQRYERGEPDQMLDEDDVFCGLVNHEEITFDGDGNDFRQWLEKNWKEVYESYPWRYEE